MRKHVFVMILSSLILSIIGGAHTYDQIKADSPNAHEENSATAGLSGFALNNDSWTTGGPYGGYINSLAMAATDPDIIYAGTESGVFKTADGGDTWTRTGFPETRVQVVQAAPDDPDIVYAGADDGVFGSTNQINGLYKSEDGGSTWTQKGLVGARVNAIAIDPLNPLVLYAGTGWRRWSGSPETIGIFKSTDGGETWQEKLSEGLDAVAALLIDTDSSSYIYAGVYTEGGGPGFRKSTDGGETWVSRKVGRLWPWDDIVALAMTPAGSSLPVIYAVNESDGDVFKSTDRGESWTPTDIPFTSETSPLAVDPNNPNVIYVGSRYYQGNLFKSTDGGDTWSIKVKGLPTGGVPSSIVIDPRNSAIYFGLSEGGVHKSTDGAESWNSSSQGINNTFIEGLAVHPSLSNMVFSAIKGGGHHLAATTNGGTLWDYLLDSPTDRGAVAIDPQNPSTIYAGFGWQGRTNRIYSIDESTDGGQSWTSTGYLFSTTGWHQVGVSDIWVNPSDSSTILVAVAGYPTVGGGVYRSTDGGATWEHPRETWATTLAADPTSPKVLYFGSKQCGYVNRSTDGGSSWTTISPSAPPGECWVWEVQDIEVDLNSQVYVATDSGLMKWDGSGWVELNGLPTDDTTALAIDRSTSPEIVYVGTGEDGVFVSQDGGSTWTPFNEGLGNLSITELAMSAGQPKILYAGMSYGGVWSRMIENMHSIYLPLVVKE